MPFERIRREVTRLKTLARDLSRVSGKLDQLALLNGRIASLKIHELQRINRLSDAEFKVFSQWGEDGIIEWLVHTLDIKTTTFVEFGVENYLEANTRFLIQNRNWQGLIIDGSSVHVESIRNQDIFWKHDLKAVAGFVTKDNINNLISGNGMGGEIGLLSMDIDGNDYWVWDAIEVVQPVICVCEYNAVFGDVHPISVPYEANFFRTRAHFSNLYFGASIAALQHLAQRKGFELVGTNLAGCNAFFVRREYFDRVRGRLKDTLPNPSYFRESRDENGNLGFLAGADRATEIRHLPVVDVTNGEAKSLHKFEPLYSKEWQRQMGVQDLQVK